MDQARQEAHELRHNYCGTEHILLGLLREQDGLAPRILNSFGIKLEEVRARVVELLGRGDLTPPSVVPLTPRSRRVLELALREALDMGVDAIGTEHILLALAHENESVAMRILTQYYADPATIRNEVIRRFASPDPRRAAVEAAGRELRGRTGHERTPVVNDDVRVQASAEVHRVMQSAAARALDDGRSQIGLADLLLALSGEQASGAVLAELGIDEASIRRVMDRPRRASDQRPPAPGD